MSSRGWPPAWAARCSVPVSPRTCARVDRFGANTITEPTSPRRTRASSQAGALVPSKPTDVAWYKPGPAPGEAGDAVIDGHLDWTTGRAVFWDLPFS